MRKLSDEKWDEIKARYMRNDSVYAIANDYRISHVAIYVHAKKYRWKSGRKKYQKGFLYKIKRFIMGG